MSWRTEVNLERYPELNAVFQAISPQQILNQLEALPVDARGP